MNFETDTKYDFSDVLIRPKRSTLVTRKDVDLERTFTFINANKQYTGVPILAANMDTIGTFEMATALSEFNLSVCLHKHYSEGELINFFNNDLQESHFYSMGIRDEDLIKFNQVNSVVPITRVCIDIANGYTERFVRFISEFREANPDVIILAGNVATAEMVEQLILAGADIVKVGLGSGSACTTRLKSGVGYPQLSAIIAAADAAHGLRGHICSDGGCTHPGDVSKAFGAGADFVMLGGMLAGHDESGGDIVEIKGQENSYRSFYGMSSRTAMEKYHNGIAPYRSAEGKEVLVPYRGKVKNTIADILGGVRSACTYVGANQLKDLTKRTTFVLVNRTHNLMYGDEK